MSLPKGSRAPVEGKKHFGTILRIVRDDPGICPNRISNVGTYNSRAIIVTVNQMVDDGYLVRKAACTVHPRTALFLTPKGEKALEALS